MKKTFFILMLILPVIAWSQDKNPGTNESGPDTELEKHPLWKASLDSERNMETILVDDRNFSWSFINFDFKKAHNLSLAGKTAGLFKFNISEDQDASPLELEPFLEFNWQLKRSY